MTAEQIADGLTRVQRDIIINEAPSVFVSGRGWLGRYRRLCEIGLLRRTSWRISGRGKICHDASYEHTKLGFEVRAILEKSHDPS